MIAWAVHNKHHHTHLLTPRLSSQAIMSSSSDSTQPGLALRPFEAKILGALLRSFEPDILVGLDSGPESANHPLYHS